MAKRKYVGGNYLDQNLNGEAFTNSASQTIFTFNDYAITSNFEGRTAIDYTNELSTFVTPVTLETLNLTDIESETILDRTENAVLNLDKSDLNTFTKFGSAYEFLRVSIQNVILNYPGSLYVNSQSQHGGNPTFIEFSYDPVENITKFKIPSVFTENKFSLIFNLGNTSVLDDNELKNLNLSYYKYVVMSTLNPEDNSHIIIGFTGDSTPAPWVTVECIGNPFPEVTGETGFFDIHLKPNTTQFEDYRLGLTDYETYLVSHRTGLEGFTFTLKDPKLLDDGTIKYGDRKIMWKTSDGYNIDIDTPDYTTFLETVLSIGSKYDAIKTDLIARFLTPASLQTYDLTDEKKMGKLLRIYGAEFDQLKQFIDSLVYINKTTYDKKNNLPDQVVSNLARTFGWNHFQLVKEDELVDKMLEIGEEERKLDEDLTPAEVDIELWRRILINTNYFWKSKGTRDAIKAMFLLIGIPEPFINITEYVYTVDGRIDPRSVPLTLDDLPSSTLPYDDDGYPIAPVETSDFYFQISGDTDSGQQYMNNFRNVGFSLMTQVDNKKSWIEGGSMYREHYSSPTYYQQDSKLVLNTKEVDVALDTSQGIEWDVWRYIKEVDFPANSSGYTLPFAYVNLSLGVAEPSQNEFTLPDLPEGDVEVRFNGTLLIGPQVWDGTDTISGNSMVDYYFPDPVGAPKTFVLGSAVYGLINARNDGVNRDVVEVTYLYKKGTGVSQITVKYIVVTVSPSLLAATIPMPETPAGDVQLTINGIAATKGTSQFTADYIVDGDNIVIQNPDLLAYFAVSPWVQMAYITVSGSTDIYARSEIARVDSLCGGRIYYNNNANRTVVTMNYKIITPESVKILVDGIALEPGVDYTVNPNNPYEVYLPANINLGSVISSYYVVGDSAAFDPIIDGGFGLGDISELSFLEFIELVQKRLINATNRKTITDFKGGWYPTLLKLYTTYLYRGSLVSTDPLKTNGYTFENLYPFLNKYNAFFQQFVDQLLAATIIQKKGGLLIRNTIFTKQKFAYKRGVSFDAGLNYFGDDGATNLKRPLYQDAEWTDDLVCIDNPCDGFVVQDINITYQTTTTTTTAFAFTSQMFIDEISSIDNPYAINGTESTVIYQLRFVDPIIPGYTVNMDLDFMIELINSGAATYEFAMGQVVVKKNGSSVYDYSNAESAGGSEEYNVSKSISISSGDVIEITLYQIVDVDNALIGEAESAITVTPNITGVLPNGSILSIIPSTVGNQIIT